MVSFDFQIFNKLLTFTIFFSKLFKFVALFFRFLTFKFYVRIFYSIIDESSVKNLIIHTKIFKKTIIKELRCD